DTATRRDFRERNGQKAQKEHSERHCQTFLQLRQLPWRMRIPQHHAIRRFALERCRLTLLTIDAHRVFLKLADNKISSSWYSLITLALLQNDEMHVQIVSP